MIIQPRRGWIAVDWRELWRHRELLFFLVWRDVKVRYKQAVLGVMWAVIAPVINVALFTLIFGRGFGSSVVYDRYGHAVPLSLFIFAAMIPWQFVSTAISQGGMSLVNQQHLLSKIYFPRLYIPASSIGSGLVDMFISFAIFFFWMAFKGFVPSWEMVFLPLLVVLTIIISVGIASLLSALTVTYRDLRFLIPFISQLGMWVSCVPLPVDKIIPVRWQWVLIFNPLFGIFDAYRSALLGMPWRPAHLVSAIFFAVMILVLGLFYFRRTERRFADIA
jgi:lipopolysaccharide transport system permease protein